MNRYTITEETRGRVLGTFEAETQQDALDAMSRTRGYTDHAEHLSTLEPGRESFRAALVDSEVAIRPAAGVKIADADSPVADQTMNAEPTVTWSSDSTTGLNAPPGVAPAPETITAASDTDEQPRASDDGGQGLSRALIADDDDDLRTLLAELLREDGFRVTEASNGRAALASIAEAAASMDQTAQLDLIVLDVAMPLHSGLEILQLVRRARWPVPVIVITAHESPVADAALKMGAAAVLSKPFTIDEFRLRVVETRNARRAELSHRSKRP